ncbi:hypothetical protein JCGZ_20697 [Jatropha curcas]|uniref:Uncharacterized protein n=1 Tax=Jatropha curcas TaxID=180498 RepID=A0A067JNI1_JATCU|nr:hypothetical protein JCGZ_20697 [Jatropha curcas]
MPPVTLPVFLHADQALSGDDASLFLLATQLRFRRNPPRLRLLHMQLRDSIDSASLA